MKLGEALQECTLALLRKIAASHSIGVADDTLRGELATQLAIQLTAPVYVSEYCAAIPEEQKVVLLFIAGHDWVGKAFLLERQFSRGSGDESGLSPCLALLQQGLIYRSFGTIGSWRGELYHVPEELRSGISAALPAELAQPKPDVRSVATPATTEQRDGAFDLFCLCSFLRRGERRAHQGFLSRFDLPKLEQEMNPASVETLPGDAEKRWRFLLHLCLSSGWVRREGNLLKPGRGASQILAGHPYQVRQRMLDRYLRDRSWSDLVETGRVRQPLGGPRIDESASRQLIIHYLHEFAGSDWMSEDGFCDSVRSTNPDFLREDYSSLSWAMVDVAAEAEVYGPDSWDPVEVEWIRYVLRGPLYWLGVVTWGRNEDSRRTAFRLEPDTTVLDQSSWIAPPTNQAVFREDNTLIVPHDVDLGLLYQLEDYMVLRTREQRASSYRFTKASVLHGMETGGSWSELHGLLTRLGEPPPPLLQQLEEWAKSYGRIVLEGSLILNAATEQEAEILGQIPGISSMLGERFGTRAYKIPTERSWQVVKALKEVGLVPRVDSSAGLQRIRATIADSLVMQHSLFAVLVVRALHGAMETENMAEAQRRLELILGPDAVEDVSKRAQEAVKRLRSRGDTATW